jgi:hypothetical protein
VITGDRRPTAGLVRTNDRLEHGFSGWPELFAVPQRLTSIPGDDGETAREATGIRRPTREGQPSAMRSS